MNQFSPLESMQHTFRRWWWVVIAVLVGGIAGWLFHEAQPPLYQATATMTVSIDFSRGDALQHWDQDRYEEDHMIGAVKALMASTAVLAQVAEDLEPQGIPPEALTYGKWIFIERKQAQMEFIVRHHDPQLAVLIANAWVTRAYTALTEAYGAALRAKDLRDYLAGLRKCVGAKPSAGSEGLCQFTSLDDLELHIRSVEAELQEATLSSKGVLPSIVFDLSQTAQIPEDAVTFQVKHLLFAGMVIGLVVGVILVQLPFAKKHDSYARNG